jgi:hypothetical protein
MRAPIGSTAPSVTLVELRDPVTGHFYILDTYNKIAHRLPIPTQPEARPTVRSVPRVALADPSKTAAKPAQIPRAGISLSAGEQLPAQMIEGVMAEGRRNTQTYPVGSIGNDRAIVTTGESWFSKDLGLNILTKSLDPRHGEQTFRLTKISHAEPDMSLFQPPPDFKIVDETGGFTMTIPRQ